MWQEIGSQATITLLQERGSQFEFQESMQHVHARMHGDGDNATATGACTDGILGGGTTSGMHVFQASAASLPLCSHSVHKVPITHTHTPLGFLPPSLASFLDPVS